MHRELSKSSCPRSGTIKRTKGVDFVLSCPGDPQGRSALGPGGLSEPPYLQQWDYSWGPGGNTGPQLDRARTVRPREGKTGLESKGKSSVKG